MELGILGFGYSAQQLAALCAPHMPIWSTRRDSGAGHYTYRAGQSSERLQPAAKNTTHLLISIPPIDEVGSVTQGLLPLLQAMPKLQWVGYCSTTGVYGDAGGDWVDETTPASPANPRGAARLAEEAVLLTSGLPVHLFRIAGIYGAGRSALDQLRAGTARRIDKPGSMFSRIHVLDIARAIQASMQQPSPGAIYNLADDYPCPAHEVVAYGAELLGMAPPPLVKYADVEAELSPMMREFYSASRRTSNAKLKALLGGELTYPTYREGLQALMEPEKIPQIC